MVKPETQSSTQWITGFEVAEAILRHKSFREVTFKGLVPLLGHVIVTLESADHRQRRTLEAPLFLAKLLKAAENSFVAEIINSTLAGLTGEICLVQLSYAFAARIAARLIGLDGLEQSGTAEEAVHLLSALVSGTRSQSDRGEPLTRRAARDELRKCFIDGAISRRRNLLAQYQVGKLPREALPSDLITLLLLHNLHTKNKLETRQIAGEVAFYAVAAVDTTANLAPHLLHELWQFTGKHPEYLPLLRDKTFLKTAAAEALRLHPAIPTIFRQATEAVTLPNGQHFDAGQVAAVYVTDANRDTTIFGPDASEFNPLRTVPAKIRRAGLSFGGGVHLCLGRELALGASEFGHATEDNDEDSLFGVTTLMAAALLEKGARPHPDKPVAPLSPYERNVYHHYPILLD
ncbi:MAG TPA: cytochrome P450 [Chloroflexia bacterium]|nr:cytochrome P450 [Chloroflexia bacterium]